jgi:L-amino acid N-acyltransferase YncA
MQIREPKITEKAEIMELFKTSIADAYKQNSINAPYDDQIKKQDNWMNKHFNGEESYYLVAIENDKIIGIMAFGEPKKIHIKHLGFSENTPLVRSAYVLPEFQGIGIGSKLFKGLLNEMDRRDVKSFYIDAGYRISQGYWKRRLGEPDVILKKYYDNDDDMMLWKVAIDSLK